MLKTIDVVAAIIEQNGKILLAQRPPHADQAGLWEFAGGKVEAGESQQEALVRELQEELAIVAWPGRYITSHRREVSGRIVHLHGWHVPVSTANSLPANTARWCGARRRKPYATRWPLPTCRYSPRLWLYPTPHQGIRTDGALIALALKQHAFRFNHRPFRVVPVFIHAATGARLCALAAGIVAEHFRWNVHFHLRPRLRDAAQKRQPTDHPHPFHQQSPLKSPFITIDQMDV